MLMFLPLAEGKRSWGRLRLDRLRSFLFRALLARRRCCPALCLAACLAAHPAGGEETSARTFHFATDTFAYENELRWQYGTEPVHPRLIPDSTAGSTEFGLRCFAMTRSARLFFEHARFAPDEPMAGPAEYRYWIGLIMRRSSLRPAASNDRIVIPGYRNLREFSQERAPALKWASGGAWRSFLQRGNWRMVFPFSSRHQERTAERLQEGLARQRPPLVHVVTFPSLKLNHALLLFAADATPGKICFSAYDPNNAEQPLLLVYDRGRRRFELPATRYFAGGRVKVYEIYTGWCY